MLTETDCFPYKKGICQNLQDHIQPRIPLAIEESLTISVLQICKSRYARYKAGVMEKFKAKS